MNGRILLHKYRLTPVETDPAEESGTDLSVHQGVEIESGKTVFIETYPGSSLTAVAREQLQADATAAKKLRHVNIPALYDFGIDNDLLVYVSEHFDGTVAEEWVRRYGPMPVSPVLHIASQVVSALSAAAFHRIIHPNINPRDLLLSPGETADGEWPLIKVLHLTGGAPKPSGNGSAAADSGRLAPYTSPEQAQHGTIDFRSEMFSLGSTMWFLLTGAAPPIGPKERIPTPGPSAEMLRGVPKSVRGLLSQMLSINPEARPGDPLAFSRLLQDCATHLHSRETITTATTSRSPTPIAAEPEPEESQWNRKRVLVVVAVPLVIAALALVAYFGYSRPWRTLLAQKPARAPGVVAKSITSGLKASPATSADNKKSATESIVENTNAPRVETDFVQRAAINMAMPPAWPKSLSMFRVPRPPEAAYAPPSNLGTFPDTTRPARTASTTLVEVPTSGRSVPGKPNEPLTSKKVAARRTAPADPDVRRAEPAPPAEGPADTSKPTQAGPKPSPQIRDNARSSGPTKSKRKADERIDLPDR